MKRNFSFCSGSRPASPLTPQLRILGHGNASSLSSTALFRKTRLQDGRLRKSVQSAFSMNILLTNFLGSFFPPFGNLSRYFLSAVRAHDPIRVADIFMSDLRHALRRCKSGGSPGADVVRKQALKNLEPVTQPVLLDFVNNIRQSGAVPVA